MSNMLILKSTAPVSPATGLFATFAHYCIYLLHNHKTYFLAALRKLKVYLGLIVIYNNQETSINEFLTVFWTTAWSTKCA